MKAFKDLLIELTACNEAKEWAGNKTIEQVVEQCHRGDWLEWLAIKIAIDKSKRVLAGGLCANTIRHLMKDERSLKAVDVAIAYGKGEASEEELNDAREAASNAAARAAWVAYASWAAAADAGAAAYAAGASWADAEKESFLKTANIYRDVMGEDIINKVNEMLK